MHRRHREHRTGRARRSGDTQDCTFTHDDLGRLASVSCGSEWSQTFSTDPFGDVAVTAGSNDAFPAQFLNDRISTVNGFPPDYDDDGNLLDNPLTQARNVYGWDADGRPVTVDGVSQTFDAFGRLVYNTAGPRQVVWTPDGYKAAVMNGQSLTFALVPLPGGAVANYGPSGISYYAHPDWEGSWRLASSPSRTASGELAYSPYGAAYAGSGPDAFTGQWVDTPDNLNDFPARFLQPMMARWLSPDPAGLAAVNPANPQSWNAYAYVGDTPLQATDPLGLSGNGSTGCGVGIPADGPCPPVYTATAWGCITCNPGPPPGWVQANITGEPYCAANPLACMGPLPHANGPGGGGGGGGTEGSPSAPSTAPQTPVNCNTVLPNGQTVGDLVRGDIAALRALGRFGTGIDSGTEQLNPYFDFLLVAAPNGPIDFKNQFYGQASAALLAREGNFAYYAIGSAFFPAAVLDAGAGAYGVLTAVFGSRPFSNLTGPLFSDKSAASVRNAALASNGCAQ